MSIRQDESIRLRDDELVRVQLRLIQLVMLKVYIFLYFRHLLNLKSHDRRFRFDRYSNFLQSHSIIHLKRMMSPSNR